MMAGRKSFDTQILAAQQHRTTGTDALIEMRRYMEEEPLPREQDPFLHRLICTLGEDYCPTQESQ